MNRVLLLPLMVETWSRQGEKQALVPQETLPAPQDIELPETLSLTHEFCVPGSLLPVTPWLGQQPGVHEESQAKPETIRLKTSVP